MDKKSRIFLSFFAGILIGGSLVLSLWVLPKYVILDSSYDTQVGKIGITKHQTTEVVSNNDYRSQDAIQTSQGFKITQMMIVLIAIYIVLLFGSQLRGKHTQDNPLSMPAYLFKISRLTGKSEYDIFFKAAEDWPVSGRKIEEDFRRYLAHQYTPYYVNDFVRKNKKHIDQLHISLF